VATATPHHVRDDRNVRYRLLAANLWSSIANDRVMRVHNAQREALKRFEGEGWKSPYQSEADAVDQAPRLADGYNRQFLGVLRQLRDLRRYAPVVIQNAQQVNVGNQQVNDSN